MSKKFLLAFFALVFASLACAIESVPELVTVEAPPPTLAPAESDFSLASEGREIIMDAAYGYKKSFYEIYFSEPFSPFAEREENGPDSPLVTAIDQARLSVDVAVYSMSLESIRDALLDAHRRGVTVRVVMESTNMERSAPLRLSNAGIEIIGDRRESLMHNKFVIIDRAEVWLGSMNLTTSGTYEENNNLVRIRSSKIAENYLTEFNEMFEGDYFGEDTLAQTPNPTLTIDGVVVENSFSPDDGVGRRILELLKGAEQSIYFMAYSFTTDDFADVLIDKSDRGLVVAGVMDEGQVKSNTGGEFETLKAGNVAVYLDGNPSNMHHKVFIIDEKIVIFGSYNFSANAERRNDENVMIVFDPDFAAQFVAEFERVYEKAQR